MKNIVELLFLFCVIFVIIPFFGDHTGAIVVFLALHLCDEVTIYGFGYDSRFTLHYYDKEFMTHTDRSTALHDVDNERELWLKLHDEGIIRLFKRDL